MPRSLGTHNSQLALARELLDRKGRERQERFLGEGPTLLAEARAAGWMPEIVFATPAQYDVQRGLPDIPDECVALVDERALNRLSAVTNPTGITAVFRIPPQAPPEALAGEHVLLLAALNDPGNVGTLLRSAEAFGIEDVIVIHGGVDVYHPKVVRATMGALFRLRFVQIAAGDVSQIVGARPLVAAAAGGEPLDRFSFPPRAIIAVGHERRGLDELRLTPSHVVGIPQSGQAESLNAGVAGSIMLYAAAAQRRLSSLGDR